MLPLLVKKKRIDKLQNAQQELIDSMEFAKIKSKKIVVKSDIIIELLD